MAPPPLRAIRCDGPHMREGGRAIAWTILRLAAGVLAIAVLAGLAWAFTTDARYVLQTAPLRAQASAEPPVLAAGYGSGPIDTAAGWRDERAPALREVFAAEVYGRMPAPAPVRITERRTIDEQAFNGAGRLEELTLVIEAPGGVIETRLALVTPAGDDGPAPLFLLPNDCGPRFALRRDDLSAPSSPQAPWCRSVEGWTGALGRFVFGRYVLNPPAETILERGYALAVYHDADFVPDDRAAAGPALARMTHAAPDHPPGALAGWAWGVSRLIDALAPLERIDNTRIALMGHSRRGKMALLAAAHDDRLAVTIAHQSGTMGAALTQNGRGEPVSNLVERYPHWFTPGFSRYAADPSALPVDQHQLLALAAPRAVLLGGASRDGWSDPTGALAAAIGADPVWLLHGEEGVEQDSLRDWRPAADIAIHHRPGTHGITAADWAAFLDFADAHLEADD